MTTTTQTTTPIKTTRVPLIAIGGLGLAGIGLAAGLFINQPAAPEAPMAAATAQAAAAPAQAQAPQQQQPVAKTAARKPARTAGNDGAGSGRAAALDTQPVANQCANCGVVETVRSFQQKGEGSGLGAVAGGVLGGVLGNQVGKGDGRKAMTVIGAVGGGVAGHEIEKRAKSETLYEVRVRMEDGSLRTITQKSAPAPGARVVVDGSTLRSADSAEQQPRMVRTSERGA